MNRRIKELAEQARIKDHWSIDEARYLTNYLDEKKFAELIVQECLEACSRANEIRHFVPPTQQQVVLSCMNEIETTFRS